MITLFQFSSKAPLLKTNLFTIPNESHITDSFFLSPLTYNEIIITANNLSNSSAIESEGINNEIIIIANNLSNSSAIVRDGINPISIKNIICIANQLMYIFNMSFAKGVFPKLLKNAVIKPFLKSGSITEPSNYRPISILKFFSKLLEKLFYNRLTAFVNDKSILHPYVLISS